MPNWSRPTAGSGRRVEYDVEAEVKALANCGIPHSDWIAKMLQSAGRQMP
jgi:hypothetical protein